MKTIIVKIKKSDIQMFRDMLQCGHLMVCEGLRSKGQSDLACHSLLNNINEQTDEHDDVKSIANDLDLYDNFILPYTEDILIDELADRMALRDKTVSNNDYDKMYEKYYEEFKKNGVKNLFLKE